MEGEIGIANCRHDLDGSFESDEKQLDTSSYFNVAKHDKTNTETIIKLEYEEDCSDETSEQEHIDCVNEPGFNQERVLNVDASKTGTGINFKYDVDHDGDGYDDDHHQSEDLKIMCVQGNMNSGNNDKEKLCARKASKRNVIHKCNVCEKEFGRKSCLNRHMKLHNNEKSYKCNNCEKSFTTHWHLLRHTSNKTECKRPHKCKICDNTFAEKYSLANHMREHTVANVCNICNEVFTCSIHTKTQGNSNLYINDDFPEYLLHSSNTWLFREQLLGLPFSSTIFKTFKNRDATVSTKTYTNLETGDVCSTEQITKQDMDCENKMLDADLTNPNNGGREMFNYSLNTDKDAHICFVCGKTFSRKSSLSRHMRTHSSNKPYKCTICPKSFLRNESLIRHEKIHTSEREIKCTLCDKFVVDLKKHMAAHTREKVYTCTLCNAMFSFKSELIHHEKNHSGKQLYKCDVCSKCFTRVSSLRRHKEIHTGVETPYKCNTCGKRFSRRWNIVRHLTKHSCE